MTPTLQVKQLQGGLMSNHLANLKANERVLAEGGHGPFNFTPGAYCHLGIIAAGSGITGVLSVITAALCDPWDSSRIDLIYVNSSFGASAERACVCGWVGVRTGLTGSTSWVLNCCWLWHHWCAQRHHGSAVRPMDSSRIDLIYVNRSFDASVERVCVRVCVSGGGDRLDRVRLGYGSAAGCSVTEVFSVITAALPTASGFGWPASLAMAFL